MLSACDDKTNECLFEYHLYRLGDEFIVDQSTKDMADSVEAFFHRCGQHTGPQQLIVTADVWTSGTAPPHLVWVAPGRYRYYPSS